ncbi:hypothetical protein G7Y89_g2820 [Cudoniella acicularis]|uniref:Uncharacterized protein n=1 Tax=Cudoniella acicularis TaxID=354080 RepID=A0A8H4RVK8_9HELO|nr:hypothetical protein G7Y89_g2820 [Cudoniella acicularis]
MQLLLCRSIFSIEGKYFDRYNQVQNLAPILEAIDEDDFQDVQFKYSLWYKSPFKGPSTPQVEDAWYSIMKYGEISVPASDILHISYNLTSVQFPPEIVQDHYSEIIPEAKVNKATIPELYERHYEYCVDYTRQYIRCKFDTTILPLNWVRTYQNPTPNGNTIHKCPNPGTLRPDVIIEDVVTPSLKEDLSDNDDPSAPPEIEEETKVRFLRDIGRTV